MLTVAIITSRWQSSRLPGKALLDICGKPMLQHVVDNARKAKLVDEVVVSTTESSLPIRDYCEEHRIKFTVCPDSYEEDILTRVYGAADVSGADYVIRLWGDAPLITWREIDRAVDAIVSNPQDNYITVMSKNGVVAATTIGMLELMNKKLDNPEDRKWIHLYLRDRKDLSINTQEDLDRVREIYARNR